MESLSRPVHRRKLSNANNFSGKSAYDGVFSGHRRKYDGAPAVSVEEYCEIFSTGQADSSIPVLDLSTLEESCDGLSLEIWSTKPDYGMIFGGFRDQGIAICYEELVARDEARARAPSSASQSSQDSGDLSNQSLDALKQVNMAYNKISQRRKDGSDGTTVTTHVTQVPVVCGFTCFMNEAASQPKKETKNQKSLVTNTVHPSVNSSKWDFPDKQTSQGSVEFRSRYQDESLSADRIVKTFEVDLKPHPSKVSPQPAASQPNKESENQKSYVTNTIHPSVNSSKGDFHEKQTSQSAVEVDLKPHSCKVSPPLAASQLIKETENQKSYITDNVHPNVNSSKGVFHEKQISQSAVEVDVKPHPSKVSPPPAASQLDKETEIKKSYITNNIRQTVNSGKGDFHEKQTSQSAVEVDLKPHPSKVSPPPEASHLNKETENQKSHITENIQPSVKSSNGDFHEKQTSQSTVEVDLNQHPSKVSPSPATSQPNKETENQKSFVTSDIHPSVSSSKGGFHEKQTSQRAVDVDLKPHSSKVSPPPADSQLNKETDNQQSYITNNIHPSVNSSNEDFHEKQTSQSAVESKSRYQDESLSGDRIFKTFEVDLKPHPSKVSSPPAASLLNKKPDSQKSYITNDIHPSVNFSKGDFHEKQTSQSGVEFRSTYGQDEPTSDDINFKKFQASLRSHSPKVSSSPAASAINFDNHKDFQKRSTATYGESPPTCFDEKLDDNSAAAVSAAALRKAIAKAQENIRIAKESVGRKKGLGGFSSKSFKDSLKVKAKVANVKAGEEYKEKDDKMKEKDHNHESAVVFPDFMDVENLFGAKKAINELYGKIPELDKNSEIPIRSPVELREFKILCSSKRVVGNTEYGSTENNTCKGPQKDVEKPSGFLVFESCEKKLGDTESNNLTVHQKVEDEKEIPGESDETGYEKIFSEESSGLFETNKQENLEQDEKVATTASQVGEEREMKEKEKVYDVCEVEMIKNADTETDDLSQKEDYKIKEKENQKAEETWKKLDKIHVPETYENSLSYHDDAEDSKSVSGASQLVNDTEKARKIDRNDSNAESRQEIDDVSRSSSSGHEFQAEDTEAIEKEKIENIFSNEAEENKDECDAKSDDLATCGLADVNFIQNDYSIETDVLSQKGDCEIKEQENHKAEETDKIQVPEAYENSFSDDNDAEGSESVIGGSQIVDDTEEACKVDQNDNAESSQEVDDVSISSSSVHDFQVEDTEALEKVMIENIYSDETEHNEDEYDAKSDDVSNCGLADVDFVQSDVRSESSSDTLLGMEIEVKEHKEREETVGKEDNNVQQSHEETPEIRIKMETGTQQAPDDKSRESEPSKMVEKMHNEEEREHERIKLAVERAIREARQRAFAEVRQRVVSDTQEKVTKASSDKTCAQSKLKAERAAVERATAEARQRALEKAISQEKMSEPKIQVKEINQTTSATNHTNTESALRSKAKLEKNNRIMERAAKALAEKEMRDLLALREQAERSRLAENLDADIKRWSSGKEGNLRALLSTLQYILGADSGWQPVSLTEIITTSAVKKAYRKATLCVHPDKLQQRGASIQQKYICEKVFDLLKAAWNRFNSEER